jgi:hypothetical protein
LSINRKKWIASIRHKNKNFYLGGFDDEYSAAIMHDAKAIELGVPKYRMNFYA